MSESRRVFLKKSAAALGVMCLTSHPMSASNAKKGYNAVESAAFHPKAGDDAAMIQEAVDQACRTGIRQAVIPPFNPVRGENLWIISRAILIPEDFTLYLDGCHLRMADGVFSRMFQNSNALTDLGRTLEGTQHNIHIVGLGDPVLDGGEPNGLNEFTSNKDGMPGIRENLTIYFHNVEDFSIENLTIVNQRWWAIDMLGCAFGRVENIHFKLTRHSVDSREVWRNQDGIDLRIGCHDITIRDIWGETGDDFIALTGLPSGHDGENAVKGKPLDIHDVVIENIRAVTNMCAIVRLLNHGRCRIYNINMNNIREISRPGIESKSQMAVRIIDDEKAYYGAEENRVRHGEIFNIHIENLYTRAMTAIQTAVTMKNMTVRNLHLMEDGQHVWICSNCGVDQPITIYAPDLEDKIRRGRMKTGGNGRTTAENVIFENIYDSAHCTVENYKPSLFWLNNADIINVEVRNVVSEREELLKTDGICNGGIKFI